MQHQAVVYKNPVHHKPVWHLSNTFWVAITTYKKQIVQNGWTYMQVYVRNSCATLTSAFERVMINIYQNICLPNSTFPQYSIPEAKMLTNDVTSTQRFTAQFMQTYTSVLTGALIGWTLSGPILNFVIRSKFNTSLYKRSQ